MKTNDINFNELPKVDNGLIGVGVGGSIEKFAEDVANDLVEQKIIIDYKNQVFCKAQKIVNNLKGKNGRTDAYFEFDKNTKINIGKLAMWRIKYSFIKWVSDFKVNYEKDYVEVD